VSLLLAGAFPVLPAQAQGILDGTILSVSANPSQPTAGQTVTITAQVKNTGTISADYHVYTTAGSIFNYVSGTISLDPGATGTVNLDCKVPDGAQPGTYSVTIMFQMARKGGVWEKTITWGSIQVTVVGPGPGYIRATVTNNDNDSLDVSLYVDGNFKVGKNGIASGSSYTYADISTEGKANHQVTITWTDPDMAQGYSKTQNVYVDSGQIVSVSFVLDLYLPPQEIPVLSAYPTSLDFGTSDTAKSFNIVNTGGGTLTWSLSSNQGWLTATPTSESGNAAITVNVNRSGLNSGTYSGTITVSSNVGSQTVSVSMQVPVATKPDLIITNVWWSPDSPKVGDKVTFYYTEKNQGAAASTDFGNKLIIDGADADISARGSLSVGQTRDRQFTYQWRAAVGTHTVVVEADWANEVAESNEGNNDFSQTLQIGSEKPDLAVSITSIDSLVIGEQPSVTVRIANIGNACIPAKRHIVSVYLIDYKDTDPSSFRAGDSYRARKDGLWSTCLYSQVVDLPGLCPGGSSEMEFQILKLVFDRNNPTVWADTLKVEIEQESPETYEDANLSNNFDEENIKVSPSTENAISCVIYASLPAMVESCGLAGGIELNGEVGTALDVDCFIEHSLQQNWPAASDDLVDIAIAAAHAANKDPLTFALGFVKGLWKGALSCASLAVLAQQYIQALIRGHIDILSAWVSCPVDILIVDEQGNRAGYAEGTIYKEIEGSEVVVVDDHKLVLIPWESSYTVMLSGTDVGTMDFQMILPGAENIAKIVEYQDVPVTQTTEATIDVNPGNREYLMMTDNNGDGQVDEERSPNLANNVPNVPSNPSPANNAPAVPVSAGLNWSGGDLDASDVITYDVYFGTSETIPLVSSNQSATTFDPGMLAYNTTYYWQIVATDDHGASTMGPLWDFTTAHKEAPCTPIWLWLIIAAGIASLVAIIVRVIRRRVKA
jgi:hypothetical protein